MDEYFLHHPLYWFQVWLVHDKNFLMFNILYHSSNFTTITRLVNGTGFIFLSIEIIFKAFNFLLVQRLDCFSWLPIPGL